jgi:hypothetical protein
MLTADRPISKKSQDLLGFSVFANALAHTIHDQPRQHGLVISINGSWGSGKTSAVELAIEHLTKLERHLPADEKTVLIRFEPWIFTGQSNLVAEFFAALAPQLKKHLGEAVADAAIGIKDATVGNAKNIFGALGTIAAILGEPATAATAKSASKITPAKTKGESVGLTQRREHLRKLLSKQKRRVLVLIDDIDRLQPDEMRLMLGMLKSVADLPGVIYLLPADVSVIRKATLIDAVSDEASFVEKIVQVNLDLPSPSRNGLDRLFSMAIKEVAGTAFIEEDELETIGYYVFNCYIKTPRNINQLANALRVSWPAMKDEVYFSDLLAVEAIRIFEPDLYKYVRRHKTEMLSGESADKGVTNERRSTVLKLLRDNGNSLANDFVRHLFPLFGFTYSRTKGAGATHGRRINDDEGYDLYFRWSPDPDMVSGPELREIQASLANGSSTKMLIAKIAKRKAVNGVSASNSLLTAITRDPSSFANPVDLIVSLLANHQEICDRANDTDFMFPASRRLGSAISMLINSIPPDERKNAIQEILLLPDVSVDAGSVLLKELVFVSDGSRPIPLAETEELIRRWVADRVSQHTSLLHSAHPARVIETISHVLGKEKARAMVQPLLNNKRFVAHLALDLMSRVQSSEKPRPYRELTRLPDPNVFDHQSILSTLATGPDSSLKKVEREDLGGFIDTLQNYVTRGIMPRFEAYLDEK